MRLTTTLRSIPDHLSDLSVLGRIGALLSLLLLAGPGLEGAFAQEAADVQTNLNYVWTFGASYIVFSILEATVGLRVGEESEHLGLDEHEHEISAYPEFASNGNGEVGEKVSP